MACPPIPPCAAIPPCPPPPCPPPPCPPPPCPPPPRADAMAGARATAAAIAAVAAMVMKLFANMIQPPWCPSRRSNANGGGLRRAERSHHLGVTGRRITPAPTRNGMHAAGKPAGPDDELLKDCVELRTAAVSLSLAISVARSADAAAAGQNGVKSRRVPIRPDRPGYAVERTVAELADEKPRRIDRPRHGGAALGNALEAGFAVIGFIAHQHDQPMTLALRFGEHALDQGIANAALAKRRLDGERTEQQGLGLADANRREPHRADQQRADARGERQFEPMAGALAQPVGRLGVAAGAEGALVQALDRHRVVGRFRPDGQREVGHLRPSALSIWRAQRPLPGTQPGADRWRGECIRAHA